jgi:hypothetical protein
MFRVIGEVAPEMSVRASYRYFWDTWDIKANTFDVGASRRFGEKWLGDAFVRAHTQGSALFYSNDATSETLYLTRNRQLSDLRNLSAGVKAAYTWLRVPGRYDVRLNGALEFIRTDYNDFTDVRTGNLYSYNAVVGQLFVTVNF